jgi:DNA-binding beta-propeller fold protein YncE
MRTKTTVLVAIGMGATNQRGGARGTGTRLSCSTRQLVGLALCVLAGFVAEAAPAQASDGKLLYRGCVSADRSLHCGGPARASLSHAESTAVSPDGKSVYAASHAGVTWFKRRHSGRLVYKGCLTTREPVSCAGPTFKSLGGSLDVAVSPNGKSVYVAARGAVTRLIRHPSGRLTFGGCVAKSANFGCRSTVPWLDYELGIAVSPDNRSVYVAGLSPIAWFKPTGHGGLAFAGCVTNGAQDGCERADHSILQNRWSVAVSPDGRNVYVTSDSRLTGGVTWFKRRRNGDLVKGDCLTVFGERGCREAPHNTLFFSKGIAVSPNGRSAYVAADGVTRFKRTKNGSLKFSGCLAGVRGRRGCPGRVHESLFAAADLALGDSGRSIYVDSADVDNAVSYLRATRGGGLGFVDCVEQKGRLGCARAAHKSLGYVAGLSASRDGRSIYVSAVDSNAVTWLGARP